MFGHKKAEAKPAEPVKMIEVKLLDDDGSFNGDNGGEIEVRGFQVSTTDGELLYLSDSGPTIEGLFYFRLAGATHHKDSKSLDGDLGQEILVVHEPTNPHDHNAIQIFFQSQPVGYVPAQLAPKMLSYLVPVNTKGTHSKISQGMVVKTFHKRGQVVGAELLVVASGYGLTATS